MTSLQQFAIQGECGSNSHIAARQMLGPEVGIVPCSRSAEVIEAVLSGEVDGAVLPIENSLHGSVAEHYDLLLGYPLRIDGESLLRIQHHVIAAPGVELGGITVLLSHPVALSQCRRFLAEFRQANAIPFYDTAGSVRHVLQEGLKNTAGIAPRLAAEIYGGEILVENIEDHPENFTRFHLLRRQDAPLSAQAGTPDKLSIAFAVQHRPGTLVEALQALAQEGADLTKIESRPVQGKPWEYVFFVDLRLAAGTTAETMLALLSRHCDFVKELGRYQAAWLPVELRGA